MNGPQESGDPAADLGARVGADGSFSLWSAAFGEGFHSADGALSEAQEKFVRPSQLVRWRPGQELVVVEVAVGTGTNTAALIEACSMQGLSLHWWGLEQDRRPLELALASEAFRRQWSASTLVRLQVLSQSDRLLWGDGRQGVTRLPAALRGSCDLVWLDAFSPRRCPQLWSLDFLAQLAALLKPDGRLITYSSAAAVRSALVAAGLRLASISASASGNADTNANANPNANANAGANAGANAPASVSSLPCGGTAHWSSGTVASPTSLPEAFPLRPLSPLEEDHLNCSAAEPYLDPTGQASAATLLAERLERQKRSSAVSAGVWRRRWGLDSGFSQASGFAIQQRRGHQNGA